jgi:hypothetical protein
MPGYRVRGQPLEKETEQFGVLTAEHSGPRMAGVGVFRHAYLHIGGE